MSTVLDDNTVIPSYMGVRSRGEAEDSGDMSNVSLRIGEIKAIIYPDDEKNQSKRFLEYRVEVQHRDGSGPGSVTQYMGAMVGNLFGGAADIFRYTLRGDNQEQTSEDGVGVGSKVLLLCVNGQSTRSIILGGIRDTKIDEGTVEKKSDGHNLFFEFNGVSFSVDKEGQAKLQFRGPTKADGTLNTDAGASDAKGPTTVEIKKNGNLKISTKDDAQFLLVDHENKKIEFKADQEWKVNVNQKVTQDFGSEWQCTVGSTIGIEAAGDITMNSGGGWNMGAVGNVKIRSLGLHVGLATDSMMKGTTYRLGQTVLHTQLMVGLTGLAAQLGIAGAAVTAACIPMIIPVVGAMIAAPILAPGGAALVSSVSMITQMITAITTFEAQSLTYLSLFNKND